MSAGFDTRALFVGLGVSVGVFVGSGIFKSANPEKRARAIVLATTYYDDAKKLAEISEELGEPMVGINSAELQTRYEDRGW